MRRAAPLARPRLDVAAVAHPPRLAPIHDVIVPIVVAALEAAHAHAGLLPSLARAATVRHRASHPDARARRRRRGRAEGSEERGVPARVVAGDDGLALGLEDADCGGGDGDGVGMGMGRGWGGEGG